MAGVHVISLYGDLDLSKKQHIEHELSQIERFGPHAITILDLSGARYVDSTILNALLRMRKRLKMDQPGSSICILAPRTNHIWRLFAITRVDSMFQMFDDAGAAHFYASAVAKPQARLRAASEEVN